VLVLRLLARTPGPASAAKLTAAQISAALQRARRRDVPARAQAIKGGTVMWWRRWIPGPKHGVPRGMVVWGNTRDLDPDTMNDHFGRCEGLRNWARMRGFALSGIPEDLELLDQAIDERPIGAFNDPWCQAEGEVGLFLGTVIVASLAGACWRLWPNGHPVMRLASGRELDVVAMGSARVSTGVPRLIDAFAAAATGPQI
jgi:hypothetical protein